MSTGLETLGADLRAVAEAMVRAEIHRGGYMYVDGVNEITPVLTGTHRASNIPWSGEESTLVPQRAPTPPLGHDDVDRAFAGFRLGQRAGFTNRQPYTGFLLAGGSPKNPSFESDLENLILEIVAT